MISLQGLATLLGIAAVAAARADFNGTGQIRTLWIDGDHKDLGCLTGEGKWTADESLCGSFQATRSPNGTLFTLSAPAGGCGIKNVTFACGDEGEYFGTFGNVTQTPTPGREVLQWNGYGIMASGEADPTKPSDPPAEIHFYNGLEEGKWVWLGWKPQA